MTNYYKLILEKLFDLLSVEFKGHEIKIFKSDNPVVNGYFIDSISLKEGEQRLTSRSRNLYFYEYPVDIILRRRILRNDNIDDFLGEYELRIRERLVERNHFVSGVWLDNIVEVSDPPEDEIIETDDEESEIVRMLTMHWIGYVNHSPTLS